MTSSGEFDTCAPCVFFVWVSRTHKMWKKKFFFKFFLKKIKRRRRRCEVDWCSVGSSAARINGPGEKVIEMDQSASRFPSFVLFGSSFGGIGWNREIIGNVGCDGWWLDLTGIFFTIFHVRLNVEKIAGKIGKNEQKCGECGFVLTWCVAIFRGILGNFSELFRNLFDFFGGKNFFKKMKKNRQKSEK